MKIVQHTHIGQRSNNEDAIGYKSSSFVLCDGMGGHTFGELASQYIVDYLLEHSKEIILSKLNIEKLIKNAQNEFNKLLHTQPESEGMGTTMCGVFMAKDSAYFTHIGDSRIYLVRPNTRKVWHTWDHSMVGELVKNGEISREEGRIHPLSNRIAQAIIANNENQFAIPEINKFTDIKKGDFIFMCSDGINESWEEYRLIDTLASVGTIEEKSKTIRDLTMQFSKDNNSFLLLEIEKEDEIFSGINEEIKWLSMDELKSPEIDYRF